MRKIQFILLVCFAFVVSGCATWSTASVESATGTEQAGLPADQTDPNNILVTEDDITDRPYRTIGDIKVKVNKTTLFHPDPTPELVDQKLREKAAELGADAVILVRYGTVGVSPLSWGSLDGNGRAVAFDQ